MILFSPAPPRTLDFHKILDIGSFSLHGKKNIYFARILIRGLNLHVGVHTPLCVNPLKSHAPQNLGFLTVEGCWLLGKLVV